MHQGYDRDSAVAGDAMPNAAIAAISASLALLTMVFLLSFVCHLAAQKRWAAGFSGCRHLEDKFEKRGRAEARPAFLNTSVSPRAVRIGSRGSPRNHGVSVESALPAGNLAGLLSAIRIVAERQLVARAEVLVEGLSECRRRHDAGGDSNNRNELLHSPSPRLC